MIVMLTWKVFQTLSQADWGSGDSLLLYFFCFASLFYTKSTGHSFNILPKITFLNETFNV